jgi:hypothetical protein
MIKTTQLDMPGSETTTHTTFPRYFAPLLERWLALCRPTLLLSFFP